MRRGRQFHQLKKRGDRGNILNGRSVGGEGGEKRKEVLRQSAQQSEAESDKTEERRGGRMNTAQTSR